MERANSDVLYTAILELPRRTRPFKDAKTLEKSETYFLGHKSRLFQYLTVAEVIEKFPTAAKHPFAI